jgi:hypothetical protein
MKLIPKILLILLFFTFVKCKTNDFENAPQLPSFNTFNFETNGLESDTLVSVLKTNDYFNWWVAASEVAIWSNFIRENIELPFVALKTAYFYEPDFFADRTWLWEYEFIKDSTKYYVDLYGTFEVDNSIFWEMFISNGGNEPSLIMQGQTNDNQTQGSWTFYKYVFTPIDVLQVDWIVNDSALNVTYINTYVQNISTSSSVDLFYLTADTSVVFLNFYDSKDDSRTKIELNSFTKIGKVKNYTVFKDSLWHCWDANLTNDFCE